MWREGGQSRERAAAKQAPDSEPELACHRRCSTYVLTHVRDRDKSRMRESRKSGSVRGDGASRTPTSTGRRRRSCAVRERTARRTFRVRR